MDFRIKKRGAGDTSPAPLSHFSERYLEVPWQEPEQELLHPVQMLEQELLQEEEQPVQLVQTLVQPLLHPPEHVLPQFANGVIVRVVLILPLYIMNLLFIVYFFVNVQLP